MFKKKECPYCFKSMQEEEEICPHCNKMLVAKRTNRATFLPLRKEIALFCIGLFGFQIAGLLVQILLAAIARSNFSSQVDYESFMKSTPVSAGINFGVYLFLFACLSLVLQKDNLKLIKTFKYWVVPVAAIAGFIAIIVFNYSYNILLQILKISINDNVNESSINTVVASYPLMSLIVFGIVGPICEEITYRVGLFTLLRRINKILGYAVTILVFAFIHFDFTSANITNELLNMPCYICAAAVFCVLYDKFGFACSLSAHMTNNLISVFTAIISTRL